MPLGHLFYVLSLLNCGAVAPQWFPPPQPPIMSAPFYTPGFGIPSYDAVDWIYPLPDFSMPAYAAQTSPLEQYDSNAQNWWLGEDGKDASFFATSTKH